MGNRTGGETRLGDPASVLTEYRAHGIGLALANNDPRAGMARLLELIHVEPGRVQPEWARVPPELRDAAERQARREGKSVSQLIRELLERYLAGKPGGVRG